MMGCAKLLSLQGDRGSASPPTPHLLPDCQFFCLYLGFLLWSVVNPASVSPPPPPLFAHPRASSLSSRQTSPAPSSPWSSFSLLLYNPSIPHRNQRRRRKAALVHRFTMSGASTLFLRRVCVCLCVSTVSGWGRIIQQESDIISENEPLYLLCCVNTSHCVTCVFFFSGFSVQTCHHGNYCHPLEVSWVITVIALRYLKARTTTAAIFLFSFFFLFLRI